MRQGSTGVFIMRFSAVLLSGFTTLCAFVILVTSNQAQATVSHIPDLRIHTSITSGEALVPELLADWLLQKGYKQQQTQQTKPGYSRLQAGNDQGQTLVIELASNGSKTAFANLTSGEADISISALTFSSAAIKEKLLALDGISVVVNPKNGLSIVKPQLLQDIYSGTLKDWSQLNMGLEPGPIHVYSRSMNSDITKNFTAIFPQKNTSFGANVRFFDTDRELAEQLLLNPRAIGFISSSQGARLKTLGIATLNRPGISPTSSNIKTEDYPLVKHLYLQTPKKSGNPLIGELENYLKSQQARDIMSKLGYITPARSAPVIANKTFMPDEYRQLTDSSEQVSVIIQFRAGNTTLDRRARRNVKRLISILSQRKNQNRKLTLIGFADPNETQKHMTELLALDRADEVADFLEQHGLETSHVQGYADYRASAQSPNVFNPSRRVEVWIK